VPLDEPFTAHAVELTRYTLPSRVVEPVGDAYGQQAHMFAFAPAVGYPQYA
jgi:hypothetical protein